MDYLPDPCHPWLLVIQALMDRIHLKNQNQKYQTNIDQMALRLQKEDMLRFPFLLLNHVVFSIPIESSFSISGFGSL